MVLGTVPPVPSTIYNHSKLQNNNDGNIETHNSIMTWEVLPPPLMAELLAQEPHATRQGVGEDLLGKEVVEAVADIRHPPHAVGFDGQESSPTATAISKVGYAPMADQCHRSPSGTQTSKL